MTKMETALASERTHLMARVETAERKRDKLRAQLENADSRGNYFGRRLEAVEHERDNANQERDEAREHNNAMRMAGRDLATAALRVVRDYDGVHRLALAVSAWAQVLADQGGRDADLDERGK